MTAATTAARRGLCQFLFRIWKPNQQPQRQREHTIGEDAAERGVRTDPDQLTNRCVFHLRIHPRLFERSHGLLDKLRRTMISRFNLSRDETIDRHVLTF